MLITFHLMTDPDDCVKLVRKLFVKDDILKKGYPRKRRSEPRTIVPIDVEESDEIELHNRFDILTRLLSINNRHDEDDNYECSDSSDSESDVSSSSERSQRRQKPR